MYLKRFWNGTVLVLSLVLVLISNLTIELRLHQFYGLVRLGIFSPYKTMQTELISKITNEKKD